MVPMKMNDDSDRQTVEDGCQQVLYGHNSEIKSLALLPISSQNKINEQLFIPRYRIATASSDCCIRVWILSPKYPENQNDMTEGYWRCEQTLRGHLNTVCCLLITDTISSASSPDNFLMISGSTDYTIRIWSESKVPIVLGDSEEKEDKFTTSSVLRGIYIIVQLLIN